MKDTAIPEYEATLLLSSKPLSGSKLMSGNRQNNNLGGTSDTNLDAERRPHQE